MKQKISIEFTKAEIDITYYALMQEMEKTFKNTMSSVSFETLEHWYLLLKKVKEALEQYEKRQEKKNNGK